MTPSQIQSMMRQAVNRQNQQLRRIQQEIERVNRANKRAIDEYNRAAKRHNQNIKQAITKYNQAVRTHNAQVRSNRMRLQQQINALRSRTAAKDYVTVQTSTSNLYERFERLAIEPVQSQTHADLVALSERESGNSITVANTLLDDTPEETGDELDADTGILEYLTGLSQDLCDRWRGAVYALNPANPDAARHFCTSAREIFTEILDTWAEDKDVIEDDPNCQKTPQGTPSRRAKIRYLLNRKGVASPELIGFVDADIDNIIELFTVFNQATHGAAGKHGFIKLKAIRQRVEGGIMFLAAVAA